MAKKGYAAEEITGFYFPGTHLVAWDEANWLE
jgi:peptidoglycan hydrolase-like amidase